MCGGDRAAAVRRSNIQCQLVRARAPAASLFLCSSVWRGEATPKSQSPLRQGGNAAYIPCLTKIATSTPLGPRCRAPPAGAPLAQVTFGPVAGRQSAQPGCDLFEFAVGAPSPSTAKLYVATSLPPTSLRLPLSGALTERSGTGHSKLSVLRVTQSASIHDRHCRTSALSSLRASRVY